MATPDQRAIAIIDGAFNITSTQAQRNRIATALAFQRGVSTQYAALSVSDKNLWFANELKKDYKNAVKVMDGAAASASAGSAVDQEFP